MLTYDKAREMLKNRKTKKVANNTYMRFEDDMYIIRHHNTDIIKITSDNHYILNTDGWRTITTKERLNNFTPARISQEKHIWYLAQRKVYYDGMIIDNCGFEYFNGEINHDDKKYDWIQKHIDEYAKEMKALKVLPVPNAGDCWICQFGMHNDCIISHLQQKYIHGSLICKAMIDAGYEKSIYYYYDASRETQNNWYKNRMIDMVRKYLWKWCQHNMDLIPVGNGFDEMKNRFGDNLGREVK